LAGRARPTAQMATTTVRANAVAQVAQNGTAGQGEYGRKGKACGCEGGGQFWEARSSVLRAQTPTGCGCEGPPSTRETPNLGGTFLRPQRSDTHGLQPRADTGTCVMLVARAPVCLCEDEGKTSLTFSPAPETGGRSCQHALSSGQPYQIPDRGHDWILHVQLRRGAPGHHSP
jgi:hypothetical protein